MPFAGLLCGIIALYGLLNFVLLPRLKEAWNASRTVSKIAKAGLLGAVQFLRDAAFVGGLMFLFFALLTVSLNFGFGQNATVLESVVQWASHAHEYLEQIQNAVEHWFFLFPLAILVYVQWRAKRSKFAAKFERIVDEEFDRLNSERAEHPETWTVVPSDANTEALDAQILEAQKQLAKVAPHGPQDRPERRRLLRLLSRLEEQRTEHDYERRIDMQSLNINEGKDRRLTWRGLLLSRGLFSDLKGFSTILGYATLAMLTLSLIAVAGEAGLTGAIENRVLRLDDLRVDARKADAEEDWKKHPAAQQNSPPSADDREAIRHLTNDFARALTKNPRWQVPGSTASGERVFRENVQRRAMLQEVRYSDGTEAFSSGLSPQETEVLRDIASGHANESRVGQIIADKDGAEIKSWFGDRWEGLKAAILEHAKLYHEPIGIDDLQGELIDRIVSAAFDATEPEGASDVVKQARDAMSETMKETLRTTVETELHRVMTDLDEGKPYSETIEKVRKAPIGVARSKAEDLAVLIERRSLPSEAEFSRRMAENSGTWRDPFTNRHDKDFGVGMPGGADPGGGGTDSGGRPGFGGGPETRGGPDIPTKNGGPQGGAPAGAGPPDGMNSEERGFVQSVAREQTNNHEFSLSEESVGALAEYEDHFPRSVTSQGSTTLGKLLASNRVAADASAFTRMAELSVERAGSFSMLRGFSKVGGVLIGQDPHGTVDLRDLLWSPSGTDITLTLVDAAGRRMTLGPYNRGLVHQSLAYAADGRPVAVTMTIARPLPELKIFLHPSLVDSPLGCLVQELDRLVDTYAGNQLPERDQLTTRYMGELGVYNVALAKRDEAVAEKGNVDSLKQTAEAILKEFEPAAAEGLRQPTIFSSDSIQRRKPEFFDPSLIRTAKSCAASDLKAFEACLLQSYRDSRTVREFKEDVLRNWSFQPASFEPWSGVRERPYTIDSGLSFLRAPSGSSVRDRLWPFDFIVQVAFTSAAVNLPEKGNRNLCRPQADRIRGDPGQDRRSGKPGNRRRPIPRPV